MLLSLLDPAARALAQAADRTQEIPLEPPRRVSHAFAYGCFVAGAGLIVGSFALSKRADHVYGDYQKETDPGRIQRLYDDAARFDRYSSASLIGGEVVIAAGLYLRFLRRPAPPRFRFAAGPDRCAFVFRF